MYGGYGYGYRPPYGPVGGRGYGVDVDGDGIVDYRTGPTVTPGPGLAVSGMYGRPYGYGYRPYGY